MATTLAPRFARRTITLAPALRPTDRERPGRRLVNIAVATAGLVLAPPLLLLLSGLVKLTSRGPPLFQPTRVGPHPPGPPPPGGENPPPPPLRGASASDC